MRLPSVLAAIVLALFLTAPAATASTPIAMVKDINPTGDSTPIDFASLGGITYFNATDGVHGRELWRSDGTDVGTSMVRDIRPGHGGSNPQPVATMGGFLFFGARDGAHGHELWKTDGTPGGTKLVKDITLGEAGTWPLTSGVAAGGHVFFNVDYQGLWSTDGTAAGTVPVGPWAEQWVALGSNLYFVDSDGALWRSDGSLAGTRQVRWAPSKVYELVATSDLLYLLSADPVLPERHNVYATDGTRAHLRKLTASPLEDRAWPSIAAAGNHAFFVDRHRLWRSNGTQRTTKVLKTFTNDLWNVRSMGSMVWLNNWDAEGYPAEIWCSDGTAANTEQIVASPLPLARDLISNGPLTFWSMLPYSTWTLWQSDGTTAGTSAVASLDVVSATDQLFASSDRVFFVLDDGSHGAELWSYQP